MTEPEHPSATEAEEPTALEDETGPAPTNETPDQDGDVPAGETEEGREARLDDMPEYKGDPLDAERGPGLGCFWIQIGLLVFFLVFTPLTVTWGWPPLISAALLIFTLILLLFSGQTIIFLLRLVAADRRTRRTPLDPAAKPTVGQMEDVDPATATDEDKAAESEGAKDETPEAPAKAGDDG